MHRSLISSAILALAGVAASPTLAAPMPAKAALATTQLPRTVRPLHYDVAITPNAKTATFGGKVRIDLEVLRPTTSITLNAADLRFSGVSLLQENKPPRSGKVAINNDEQTATFSFPAVLGKGRYALVLEYTGIIGNQPVGLFSIDYDMPDGHKRALYTQFENSDARRMIPSWDEPAYKATFSLEATVPASEMAVSNMPIATRTDLTDGRSTVRFATTPKMSTYLLFFGLGEFERTTTTVDGTEIGVVSKKGGAAQATYVLDESKAILREYNDYFGQPYPLPKLDNVAAPGRSQFFGAMENWGAIFTFEYAMLVDPAISTPADKQEIFAFAAHEMAHQWFGDLVTMRWWDDLWLNEGFASWMESRLMERLHPEWNSALGAIDGRERAMLRDSVATTHPVVQRIKTVEQASQAFDSITYKKGEMIIRMLENYVGADAWRNGVRAYMRAHAYNNTVSDDLWRNIEQAAGKPITAIAHDFTLQPGVPMIEVEHVACKDGQTVATLRQTQFSRDQRQRKPLLWQVPVVAQVAGNNATGSTLVVGGKGTVTAPGCGALVVNAGQPGYFRTLYRGDAFAPLATEFPRLAPIDQMGLLADSWALGLAGRQPVAGFLDLAHATPVTADAQVWGLVAGVFNQINRHYRHDAKRRAVFARYAIARLSPVLAGLGWTPVANEADTQANLRTDLIATLSALGDADVIGEARRRYAAQATEPAAVPAALRKTILAVVAEHADTAAWDGLRKVAQEEKSAMIKDQLYALLASARDPNLAKRALELALTDEPGVTNSASMISAASTTHPDLAFDFALAHLPEVNARIDASSRSRFMPLLADGSANPAMPAKLNAYARVHLAASARAEVQAAISAIKDRIEVRAKRLPDIDQWLARHAP